MEPIQGKYLKLKLRLCSEEGRPAAAHQAEIYDVETGAQLACDHFEVIIAGDVGGYEETIDLQGNRIRRERQGHLVHLVVHCLAEIEVRTGFPFKDR